MSNLLDIIGGLLIFGVVLLMSLQLNIFSMEQNTQSALRSMSQETISGDETGSAGLGKILETDLSRIGLADTLSPSVLIADSTQLKFRGDVNNNGTLDSVRYYITNPGSTPAGGNPNLKYLYRRQNTESGTGGRFGVSQLKFLYLDDMGKVIPTPVSSGSLSSIKSIKVQLMVSANIRLKTDTDTSFAASYWESLVSPPNIK